MTYKQYMDSLSNADRYCFECGRYQPQAEVKRCQLTGEDICDDCRDDMCANECDPSSAACHYCEYFLTSDVDVDLYSE